MAPPSVVGNLSWMKEFWKGWDKVGASRLEKTVMGYHTPGLMLQKVSGMEVSGLVIQFIHLRETH